MEPKRTEMPSYYSILGVRGNASREEIVRAYRKRALRTHPDRGGSEAEFKLVAEAYETLSDPTRRFHYDRGDGGVGSSHSHAYDSTSTGLDPFSGPRAFDIFDQLFPELLGKTSAPRSSSFSSLDATTSLYSGLFGGSHLMDSFFEPQTFNAFSGPFTSQTSSRCVAFGDGDCDARATRALRDGHSSAGVIRNPPATLNDWSFSTSFDGTTSGRSGWTTQSQSKFTRIVNGRREEVTSVTDTEGNKTVHRKRSDGTEQVLVNGAEDKNHPLLQSKRGQGAIPIDLPSNLSTGSVQDPIVLD